MTKQKRAGVLRCRLPCVYTLLYIYKSGAAIGADWLPLLFRCRGAAAHVLQLSGVGCADHVGRLVAFLVALRGVGWLSVGRGAAVLMWGGSRLSCRIWSGCRLLLMVSDVAPISAAVPVAHALRLVADWLRILSGCRGAHALQMSGGCRGHLVGIGCRCSSLSVGRGGCQKVDAYRLGRGHISGRRWWQLGWRRRRASFNSSGFEFRNGTI